MRPATRLAFILFAALTILVVGAGVSLAQEDAVPPQEVQLLNNWLPGDDTVGAAYANQLAPAISQGGSTTLVAWTDSRAIPPGGGGEYETSNDIYGMRLDAAGNPLDPVPFVITQARANQGAPQIAWNGTHWLVVFETTDLNGTGYYYQKYLAAVRVAPSGAVIDPAPIMIRTASPTTNSWAAASNGADWLVVYQASDSSSAIKMQRITAAGVVEQPPKTIVPSTYYLRFNFKLAYAGGIYLFTWTDFYDTYALRIDSNLNVLDASPIVLVTDYGLSALTANSNQFYIVWHKQLPDYTTAVTGSRVDTNGQKLDGSGDNISMTNQPEGYTTTSAVWDSSQWKVTWANSGAVRIARVSAAGQVLDPGGVLLNGISSGPTAATFTAGVQIAWSPYVNAQHDVLTANISSTNVVGPNKTLSTGGPAQFRADAAVGANGYMMVYRSDIAGVNRVMAQPLDANGNPLTAGPVMLASGDNLYGPGSPTVAWNGSLYVAAWATSDTVYARRIQQDGTVLDAAPITVMPGFGPVDLSALGDTFLVVGHQIGYTPELVFPVGSRVRGSDGVSQDPAGRIIGGSYTRSLAVTTLGSRWFVVWQQNATHDNPAASTVSAFVNADGSSTTPMGLYGYSSAGGNGIFEVAAASSGSNALVLQSAEVSSGVETDLVAVLVNSSGAIQSTTNLTPWAGNQYRPRVAWDGNQYVLAYNEQRNRFAPWTLDQIDARSDLFGMRITSAGAVVDPKGFAYSISPLSEAFPNVTGAGGVSLLSGSIVRNEHPFAAYRAGYTRLGVGGNQWPVAVAGSNTAGGNVPLTVNFTSAGSTDPDGSIVSYAWSFGDGGSSTSPNPSHTYNTPGEYVATLTVTDNQGVQTVNTAPIAAAAPNQLPIAVATADPMSGPAPLDVTFFGEESYDPDGSIGNYEWLFSDGGSYWGATAYHTFYNPGTYQVTLKVYDNRGGVGTTTLSIQVGTTNQPPNAVASGNPTSGTAPLAVNFSSAGSNDPDGNIVSYAWTFGDGGVSSQPNPAHTYTNAGNYTATLTVTDDDGATDNATVNISVTASGCSSNCLRSTAISLKASGSGTISVKGQVQVRSENNALVSNARVYVTWTLPGGGTVTQDVLTNSRGIASFGAVGSSGTFTLTVTNITKTGWTFDPEHSVLTKSVTR